MDLGKWLLCVCPSVPTLHVTCVPRIEAREVPSMNVDRPCVDGGLTCKPPCNMVDQAQSVCLSSCGREKSGIQFGLIKHYGLLWPRWRPDVAGKNTGIELCVGREWSTRDVHLVVLCYL